MCNLMKSLLYKHQHHYMNKKIGIGLGIVIVVIIIGMNLKHTSKPTTLSIGVISTLSGKAAYIGESTMKGAEIGKEKALKEHPGLSITTYNEDSMFTPKGGIDAYNKLRAGNNINGLITMASNVSVAVEPLAIKDNVLDIAVSTLANGFTTPDDLTFRITSKADSEAAPAIQYLAEKHLSKLGIMYMNNEIGTSLNDALKKTATGSSVNIVAAEAFPADATDFKTALLKMKDTGVDSIYLASLASHSSIILKQAHDLNIKVPFVSYRAAEDPTLIKNAGALAEQLVYTNAYDSAATTPENAEFSALYMAKYGEQPNGYAAEAYEAVRLIADAYVKCGDTTVSPEAITCTKSFLFAVKDRTSLFGPFSFDQNGDVSYGFFMKTVKDGKFVRVQE